MEEDTIQSFGILVRADFNAAFIGRSYMGKVLLAVDLQRQFADKNNNNENYNKCLRFVEDHKDEYNSCIATLFKQDKSMNPNYELHLGWEGCADSKPDDLEFKNVIERSPCRLHILTKCGYGFSADNLRQLYACLPASSDEQIDIIGCDADACVMAVCFQLWDAGYKNIHILTDFIYTTADCEKYGITKEIWISIMRRNFGDCVIIPQERVSFDALFAAPDKTVFLKLLFESIKSQGEMCFCDGAKEEEIVSFENENSVKLPMKYREWLRLSDGGELFLPAGLQLYGVKHKPIIEADIENRPSEGYFTIGVFAWGDPVLIKRNDETISVFNHEAGAIEDTFEDFEVFMDRLYDYLGAGEE